MRSRFRGTAGLSSERDRCGRHKSHRHSERLVRHLHRLAHCGNRDNISRRLNVSIAYAGSNGGAQQSGQLCRPRHSHHSRLYRLRHWNTYHRKAKPVITWATPAPITAGTVLSATQLDATASVPGTFVYSPAAGTTPAVGTDVLSTTFTPTDTTDYNTATATVSLTVTAATNPRVVWIPDFYGNLLQVSCWNPAGCHHY